MRKLHFLSQMTTKLSLVSLLISSSFTIALAENLSTNPQTTIVNTSNTASINNKTSTTELVPPRLQLPGYSKSLTDIYNLVIDQYQTNKLATLQTLTQNYNDFLAQVSGLEFNAKLYNSLKYFSEGFIYHMKANKANASLFYQFAQDVRAEEQAFMSIPTENGYPALPKTNALGNYGTYRSQLVNIFNESLEQRLQDYHLPNFQNKYFDISADRHEVPDLINNAEALVHNYLFIVKLLTYHSLVCDYLNTQIIRSQCFRNYMQLITELPSVLASDYYLSNKDNPNAIVPTDSSIESLINPVINYYRNYANLSTLVVVPTVK